MTPEQQLANYKHLSALDRTITLIEYYARAARESKAVAQAAMQASRQASGLVMANDAGQMVGNDEKAQAAAAANGMAQMAQESLNNLVFAAKQLVGLTQQGT